MVSSVINQGLQGMQTSMGKMHSSADRIAKQNIVTSEVHQESSLSAGAAIPEGLSRQESAQSFEEALVNMKVEQRVYEASAKVVQTGADTLGALINIKA